MLPSVVCFSVFLSASGLPGVIPVNDCAVNGIDGEEGVVRDLKNSLTDNLSEDFSIGSVSISGRIGILDDDCAAFKEQIKDYFLYGVTDHVVSDLIRKTGGNDEPVSDDAINAMDSEVDGLTELADESEEDTDIDDSAKESEESVNTGKPAAKKQKQKKDPRKKVKKTKKKGMKLKKLVIMKMIVVI